MKVVICALPLDLLKVVGPKLRKLEEGADLTERASQTDFHDLLKARAMAQGPPIQLVLPATYDPSKQRRQSRAGVQRTLQDEATRAWNIYSALYYKAGGVPWRLPRDNSAYTTCYVGVSFYYSLDP